MFNELKIAARSLARSPAHTLVVILTLGLGVGAAATCYSLFSRALLPRAPYPDPARLVRVELVGSMPDDIRPPFMLRFLSYREAKSFSVIAGLFRESSNMVLDGVPEGVWTNRVTANYFSLLGQAPQMGRLFVPEDEVEGSDDVVVLTDAFWRNRFGADTDVVGRRIELNSRSCRVVGVLPENYLAPEGTANGVGLFRPLVLPRGDPQIQSYNQVVTLARLRPGVSVEQAVAELRTFHPEAGTGYTAMAQFTARVSAVAAPMDGMGAKPYRRMMWTGVAAVGFLYALSCVNAGSLILVRTVGRRREIGIRLSLGGSRWAVIRPMLYESVMLASGAVALAGLVAKWLSPVLLTILPGRDDGLSHGLVSQGELAIFLAGMGILTGIAVLAIPAWWTGRMDINEALKQDSGPAGESPLTRRLRGLLVVAEAALAVVLLTGAGLMVRTFVHLQAVSPGYEATHRYVLRVAMDKGHYQNLDQMIGLRQRILDRLASEPGVSAVGMGRDVAARFYVPMPVKIVGRPDAGSGSVAEVESIPVSTGFLETLGLALRVGHGLGEFRRTDVPVVVINESMARRYFSGRNPIGERLEANFGEKWEIVGVVADVRSFREEARPRCYFPFWQLLQLGEEELILKTHGVPGPQFSQQIRRAVFEVDPKLAVMSFNSLEAVREQEVANEKAALLILQTLSGLALVMAVAGLFSTMAYSVAQRRAEFGVRLALGAPTASLYRLVMGSGVGLAAMGVAIGLAASWGLARFLDALLIGTTSRDPLTFAAVGLLMLAVALPACWLPARRAARVDVTKLLRAE